MNFCTVKKRKWRRAKPCMRKEKGKEPSLWLKFRAFSHMRGNLTSHTGLCSRSLQNFHKNMKKISNSGGLGSFTASFREQLCRWQSALFSSHFFESCLIFGISVVRPSGLLNIHDTRLNVVPHLCLFLPKFSRASPMSEKLMELNSYVRSVVNL